MLLVIFSLLRDEDLPEDMRAESPFRNLLADQRERIRRAAVEKLPEIVCALHRHALHLDKDEDFEGEEDGEPAEPHVRGHA